MVDKEILLRLLKLDGEIKNRRKKNKLLYYNKGERVHQKQEDFHRSQAQNRWIFGGNRSGKTECGAAETAYILRGIHPYRKNIKNAEGWIVSLSLQVQRDVAQKKLLEYINPEWISDIVMHSGSKSNPKNGIIDFIEVRNVFGGVSRVGFRSCDQGREKFQGASLDFVWFDEEPPEDIYDECRVRVLDRCGFVFGTMTPLKGLTFVYEKIYLAACADDSLECFQMEWADNPWLDKQEVKRLTALLDEGELEKRRYGRFYAQTGLVYSAFDPKKHIIEPFDVPPDWYENISIDPGLHNPLSAHWYAVDGDGVIYVIAEHYEAGKTISYHSQCIKNICQRLNWHTDSQNRICALIDSAAGQKTLAAAKSVSELFYDFGILVNTKVNKDVFCGISRVKQLFESDPPRIYIFKNCTNLVRELKSYFWGEGDRPQKKNDHALDELRYFVMSRPEPNQIKKPKTIIQADKEKRMRKKR